MAVILSVSIDSKQKQFLDEIKVSPSALLQRSINELMQNSDISKEYVEGLKKNIGFLQKTISKQGTFIDKNGLMQDYLQFEDV
jgi:hypothetical protein